MKVQVIIQNKNSASKWILTHCPSCMLTTRRNHFLLVFQISVCCFYRQTIHHEFYDGGKGQGISKANYLIFISSKKKPIKILSFDNLLLKFPDLYIRHLEMVKGGLISEGIFNLVPSSQKYTMSQS